MKTVLVDDHNAFRQSLRVALNTLGPFVVTGDAADARTAQTVMQTHRPMVMVSDLLLKDSDGISLFRELKRQKLQVPTLMLTRVTHPTFVRDAFAAGIRGYILKEQPLADVVDAMTQVVSGGLYLSPKLGLAVDRLQEAAPAGDPLSDLDRLSRREREIFCRLLDGHSSKDIAQLLCISVKTVDTHRYHINRKLGVRSPYGLMSVAARHGLVTG